MEPIITPISPTYKRPDTDLWVLNAEDIPIPYDRIKDKQYISVGPKSFGGNHKHPRIEWFIAIGNDLEFHWLDDQNKHNMQNMNPDGQLYIFEVPPYLPHAVYNAGSQPGVLLEFADAKMSDVERVVVLEQ